MHEEKILIKNEVNITGEAEIQRLGEVVKKDRQEIAELKNEIRGLNDVIDELNNDISSLQSGTGFDTMKAKIEEMESTAYRASKEVVAFLKSVNLDDWSIRDGEWELFEKLENGAITAGEAITKLKVKYADLIKAGNGGAFDISVLNQFVSTLDRIEESITAVSASIKDMQVNGVKSSGEISSSGNTAANALREVKNAADQIDTSLDGSYEAITKLVYALTQYSQIDGSRLIGVSNSLRSLADISQGSFGEKSVNNLISLVARLQNLTANGGEIRFNFTGFDNIQNLKVSKTSLNNLATYLPEIAKADTGKLNALSAIDWSNLTNLRVSKASVNNLAELAGVSKTIDELRVKVEELTKAEAKATATGRGSIFSGGDFSQAEKKVATLLSAIEKAKQKLSSLDGGEETKMFSNLRLYEEQLDSLLSKLESSKGSPADFKEFQTGLNEIGTVLRSTQDDIDAHAKKVKQAAEEEKQVAKEAAEAAKERAAAERQAAKERSVAEKQAAKDAAAAEKERMQAQNQAAAESQKLANLEKTRVNSLNSLRSALNNSSAAESSNNLSSQEAYAKLKEYERALEDLGAAYRSKSINAKEFADKLREIQTNAASNIGVIKQNGDYTKTWGDRLAGLAQKFSSWLSVSQAIMFAIRGVRQMMSASIELDSAMTELKIVTDESDASYERFASTISQTAQNMGVAITDLIKATTTFARLGYGLEDAQKLAEYVGKLQAVGGIETQDAQDSVTAILKAFSDEVDINNIESVMDKLVIVGNNAPVSVSQIAEAMNNASSALSAAGNSFDESVALITAANTTIQNASRSSTGLRTIAARIRNVKTELEELGEEALTEAQYDEIVQALTSIQTMDGSTVSVSLTDAQGQLRSTYDIIKDIAAVWDEMDKNEQAALAKTLAGKIWCQSVQKCA